jgi:hypothetical protein
MVLQLDFQRLECKVVVNNIYRDEPIMKKKIFPPRLISTTIFGASILLSGCQGLEQIFGEPGDEQRSSANYSYGNTQHNVSVYQSGVSRAPNQPRNMTSSNSTSSGTNSSTDSSPTPTSETTATTRSGKKTSGAAVPTDAPTVPSMAPTVGQ